MMNRDAILERERERLPFIAPRQRHRVQWRNLRIPIALAGLFTCAAVGLQGAGLMYNTTPSEPTGFYWLRSIPAAGIKLGDQVSFCPPVRRADYSFLAHGSCPGGTAPFFKTVVGVPGDVVVVTPTRVMINGRVLPGSASLQRSVRLGVKLPHADGIWRLGAGQYWLYGAALPQYSFDSRYWGVLQGSEMIGVARQLSVF